MTEELKQKIHLAQTYFKNFDNYIELNDFRSFLLFTLISQVPSNLLAQIGLGGSKDVINLPYNPLAKIYYQKINLLTTGALVIYIKSETLSNNFILEKDDPIFKKYLNTNEINLAFRGKEKFLFPKITDCSLLEGNEDSRLEIKIDDLYHSLESFIAVAEPNILFIIEGDTTSKPDLIFSFNMMPDLPGKFKKNILKIDVYLDEQHKTKGMTYLKREEDYKINFLKDIKEISHSEIYKSSFSLILPIKSFKNPYSLSNF